jgi:hypothetical protein
MNDVSERDDGGTFHGQDWDSETVDVVVLGESEVALPPDDESSLEDEPAEQ